MDSKMGDVIGRHSNNNSRDDDNTHYEDEIRRWIVPSISINNRSSDGNDNHNNNICGANDWILHRSNDVHQDENNRRINGKLNDVFLELFRESEDGNEDELETDEVVREIEQSHIYGELRVSEDVYGFRYANESDNHIFESDKNNQQM